MSTKALKPLLMALVTGMVGTALYNKLKTTTTGAQYLP